MAQKLGLSNNQLKMIAMLTMLCDHVALTFFPSSLLLRILGRISFPIFAYMIAEGCRYTKCRWKHFAMLFGLGAICQVVFLVAMNSWYMGILLTFSLSILTIYAIDSYLKDRTNRRLGVMIAALCGVVLVSVLLPGLLFEYGFTFDYGPFGVFLPVAIYYARLKWLKMLVMLAALIGWGIAWGGVRWFALLALPFLLLYNGERGRMRMKYLFYIFYPSHLVLLYLISLIIRKMQM